MYKKEVYSNTQMAVLTSQVDQLSKKAANDVEITRRLSALEDNFNTLSSSYLASSKDFPPLGVSVKDQAACNPTDCVNANWSNVASSGDLSSLNLKKQMTTPRVIGSGSSTAVRAIPRPPVLSAFVGRLDLQKTADELSNYLKDSGVKVVRCAKLKGR